MAAVKCVMCRNSHKLFDFGMNVRTFLGVQGDMFGDSDPRLPHSDDFTIPRLMSGTEPMDWTGDTREEPGEPFPWLLCLRRNEGDEREGGREEEEGEGVSG